MTTTGGALPANVLRVSATGRVWATNLRLGGALLTIAGVTILMGIITAEALYPNIFTTGGNEISDLFNKTEDCVNAPNTTNCKNPGT